jgi:DNA helicase-2/ATP-dependent DNA helicase PcrA
VIDFESAPSSGGAPAVPTGRFPPAVPRTRELPAYIHALNDRQREAALITDGPLIVLAGAGSGKTKMLTSRIAYLIDVCRVPAWQILAVTFTNKAAAEMRERVEKALHGSDALGAPEIGTFHSVCVRILRREQVHTPFTKPFVIYDDSDQLSLVKATVAKLGIDEKSFSPKALQSGINRVKCDGLEPRDIDPKPHDIFERQLKRVYEQYQKDLFANNALDFGEILCMVYRIFRDHPDVRAKYQHRFRYIHIDEYQDTNRAQYLLMAMLTQEKYGGHGNICVVGDEDQSIYKWRGADIRNILDFEHDFPGTRVVKLEQNYRSTQTIIKAAGQVIRNNRERKDKTLWTDNDVGTPVVRVQLPDERAEAEMTVAEIKRIAEEEGRTFDQFAIFYRTHAQSRQYEDVLRREKIPYNIVGGLRFYDRKEIKDVLSYFKVVLNPADSISLKRIINSPARGIGKTTIDKLEELALERERDALDDRSLWAATVQAASDGTTVGAGTARKLQGFVKLMQRLMQDQPKLMLSELYHLILDETGYVRELRQENTEESMARIENLEEFDTILQEFEEEAFEKLSAEDREARKPQLLEQFIEQSSLASEADSGDLGVSAVKMMSLHSSKGLEFPVVFLGGMEEGLFPSVKAWEEVSDEDVEEERRLCYVGMTRARERLYCSHVMVRRIWGNVSYQEPARFFQEMPGDAIEFRDLARGAGAGQFRTGSSKHYGLPRRDAGGYRSASAYDDFSQLPEGGDDDREGRETLVGMYVNHPEYGRGTILQAEGSGQDQKVTIEFKGRDRRKFVFRYVRQYLE